MKRDRKGKERQKTGRRCEVARSECTQGKCVVFWEVGLLYFLFLSLRFLLLLGFSYLSMSFTFCLFVFFYLLFYLVCLLSSMGFHFIVFMDQRCDKVPGRYLEDACMACFLHRK